MTTAAPDKVDATTVRSWLDQPDRVTVLDVRSPAEFETARIPGSINVPLNLVEKHAGQLVERLDRQVVLVCQAGNRATQAQQRLAGAGAEHLHVLDGGVWRRSARLAARSSRAGPAGRSSARCASSPARSSWAA